MRRTSFIRLHAKYRERGVVLTRDNHEIMRAISTTFRFILAFYNTTRVLAENRWNNNKLVKNMTHSAAR